MVITAVAPGAAAAAPGVAATDTVGCSRANASTAAGDASHTMSEWPAFNKLDAMWRPIWPRPIKAILWAAAISKKVACPTIGIGSGKECDGGILVLHDLIGLFPWFRPKFATPRADVATAIQNAVREYSMDIKNTGA